MNLSFFIAKRYLLAKKSHNAINIITSISIALVAIGTMALIVIMSVFNGLETLVGELDSSASADYIIDSKFDKYINTKEFPRDKISAINGVNSVSAVLEDNLLVKYTPALEQNSAREIIALIRGVEDSYTESTSIKNKIIDGVFYLNSRGLDYCVLGNGLANHLQIHINDFDNPIICYFPKADQGITINPLDAISIENVFPAGVVTIAPELDDKIIITSLAFAQKLMNIPNRATNFYVGIGKDANIDEVQNEIQHILGSEYSVKNKKQQNEVMYNIMKSEKWSSFMILSFILFIATFNLVGALSVLIIDKQSDIKTLTFMGADKSLISKIFMIEGFMVTFSGTLLGLFLGAILIIMQDTMHIIPMQGSFIIDAFPVELRISDIISILAVVVSISMLAVVYPIRKLGKVMV
ncbi:MAG: ABC transporter permease [Bacteroidales bacterium]|nr:ABC transporter permease [Bacteroidales bacterium]